MTLQLDLLRRRDEEITRRFTTGTAHAERARDLARELESKLASTRDRLGQRRTPIAPTAGVRALPGLLFAEGARALPREATVHFLDTIVHRIAVLNQSGMVLFGNAAWQRSLAPDDAATTMAGGGVDYFRVIADQAEAADGTSVPAGFTEAARAVLKGERNGHREELLLKDSEASRYFLVDVMPLPRGGAIVVHVDATLLIERRREVERQALRDGLTDLLNHQAFHAHARKLLANAIRHQRTFHVLMIDVDEFKSINDRFGHHAGDYVLVKIAQRLRGSIREGDVAGRLGGDEFAALAQESEDATELCDRIAAAMAEPITLERREIRLGSSVGVASFPQDGRSVDDLLRCADERMYRAKRLRREGRDGCEVNAPEGV